MAIQVPSPPSFGVLSSIISLVLIYQALQQPESRFTGYRPTELPFIHPPQTKRCRKWVFPPPEPGRALQVPTPPDSGVLSSIGSLLLIF